MVPDISIIIVNRNRSDLLVNCLDNIYNTPCRHSFEIIIVDNASTDDSVHLVEQNFRDVKIIRNDSNLGFSAANNQGIKIAKGKFILFLNSDTIVLKNAIDILADFLEQTPDAGLCAPKLLNNDRSIQRNVYRLATFRSILARYTILKYFGMFKKARNLYRMRNFTYDNITKIDRVMGAAMMAKKEALNKSGLFDENYFFYFEDADLCLQFKKCGFEVYFVPNAEIIHLGGQSAKSLGNHKTEMMFYRSMFYYFRKNRGKVNTFLFSLVFKPLAILYYLLEGGLNSISAIFPSAKRRQKLARAKTASLFLIRFLPEFLFR
ncbi:MAG: glycosyltransferase family 2 protein [Phycisphaerae bacterium]|nr:glycosyltransferase family 2 protein [Phycisphaerae bacterium]